LNTDTQGLCLSN